MPEVAAEARERDLQATLAAESTARTELAKQGVKFTAFPPEEAAKWRASLPDFFADFIVAMEKQGRGADAKRAVEIWKDVTATVK